MEGFPRMRIFESTVTDVIELQEDVVGQKHIYEYIEEEHTHNDRKKKKKKEKRAATEKEDQRGI